MWYLKNVSEQIIKSVKTQQEIKPNEVACFTDEYDFLYTCSAYNGYVLPVEKEVYDNYIASLNELSHSDNESGSEDEIDVAEQKEKKTKRSKK